MSDFEKRKQELMASIKDRRTSFDELANLYAIMLCDEVDDEEAIQKEAEKVLPEIEVYGDSYSAPCIVTITESLVSKIQSLTAENERLRGVVEAAKAVDWRKVIRSQPRVIWWKYECWRNYGKFEAAIEELDNE